MMNLSTKIEELPKIGASYSKKLKKFGIKTIQDLLFHFPARYDDFSQIIKISDARHKLGQTVCMQGKIIEIKNYHTQKKWMSMTEAVIEDQTGEIKAIW